MALTQLWAKWQAEQISILTLFFCRMSRARSGNGDRRSSQAGRMRCGITIRNGIAISIARTSDTSQRLDVSPRTFFVTGFEDRMASARTEGRISSSGGRCGHRTRRSRRAICLGCGVYRNRIRPGSGRRLIEVAERHDLRVWGPGLGRVARQLQWNGRRSKESEFAAVCSSSAVTLGINPARAGGWRFIHVRSHVDGDACRRFLPRRDERRMSLR